MGATPTKLHALRERLAAEFAAILQEGGEPMLDKYGQPIVVEGQVLRHRQSPAMLTAIAKFLKDNGIDREPLDGAYDRPAVVDTLPFQEPQELGGVPPHLLAAVKEAEREDEDL